MYFIKNIIVGVNYKFRRPQKLMGTYNLYIYIIYLFIYIYIYIYNLYLYILFIYLYSFYSIAYAHSAGPWFCCTGVYELCLRLWLYWSCWYIGVDILAAYQVCTRFVSVLRAGSNSLWNDGFENICCRRCAELLIAVLKIKLTWNHLIKWTPGGCRVSVSQHGAAIWFSSERQTNDCYAGSRTTRLS